MTCAAPKALATCTRFSPTPPTAITATVSPVRIPATLRTAPTAVKTLQPRIATSSSGSPSGTRNTSVSGTTEYSAMPAMEYIATGLPSGRNSRVSPS